MARPIPAGWPLPPAALLLLLLFGQCATSSVGRNCCHAETKKFLVPRGTRETSRLYGSPPGSGASGCTPATCGGAAPEPPPPPPPGTCPGADVCQGPDTCGAQQGFDSADSTPHKTGLVDFEILLKDYAFYDEVDKRILTYQGDKKGVRFAPGTKKDPSDPIYSHDLKSVIDYEHREDDCTDSFWGCLVGDLVADVLSESSNETKELVEEVIHTLEVAHDIGHAVLDHLEGHPGKQRETNEEESFDVKRKRRKTNYPFLQPDTEETCPGCGVTEESQSTADSTPVQNVGDECQKDTTAHGCCGGDAASPEPQAVVEEAAPQAGAGCGDACGLDDLIQEATTQEIDVGCGDACGVGEETVKEAAPETAAEVAGEEGGCDCDALVSKSGPFPAKRCLVSAERKSRDNYPFLEDKSKSVLNCGPVNASSYDKAKVSITKHAGGVMSAVMDSHQTIDKVQKAIFAKANDALSNVLTNLTKTGEMTEKVTKIVCEKANDTLTKVFAMQINETGIPSQV